MYASVVLLLFLLAVSGAKNKTTNVRKCCPNGFIFDQGRCDGSNNTFIIPKIHTWPGLALTNESIPVLTYGFPACETFMYYLDPYEDPSEKFTLLETGWLVRGDGRKDPPGQYCFDVIANEIGVRPVVCFLGDDEDPEDPEAKGMFAVYPVGMLVSIPFLLLTFFVYAMVSQLRNLHGLCLMFHVASLIASYSSLIIVQIASSTIDIPFCIILVREVRDVGEIAHRWWVASLNCILSVFSMISTRVVVLYITFSSVYANITVRKCCPNGEGYIRPSRQCNETGPWNITVPYLPSNFNYKVHDLECKNRFILRTHDFVLTQNGLFRNSTGFAEDYCMELVIFPSGEAVYPFLCFPIPEDNIKFVFYPYCLFLSVILFCITLFVYTFCLPPRSKSSLHTALTVRYIIANLIGFLAGAAIQWDSQLFDNENQIPCIVIGFAVQFFFLATFFWLNVMCIDIYWAFSGFKIRGSASERNRKKLLAYSIYAWGMPLIILAVTVAVDYWDFIPPTSHFKPNIGKDRCFFKGRLATWTYFYGPMALILFSNLILFAITAYRIWRQRRENAVFQNGDSRRHDRNESERFNLYLKLFLVMGINWISELVSFMFGKEVPQYLWYITDITNTLQGVFIFLIFVWKKRVRKLLWEKLKKKESRKGGSTTTCVEDIN